jgi:hypothetical protein
LTNNGSSDSGSIQPVQGQAIRFDPLNPHATGPLMASLSEEQQNALLMEYMRGNLDVGKKAAQMRVDVEAFKNTLDVMAAKTRDLSTQEGVSIQVQHTQETSIGKTEVIMGNTAQAASGRLTRTMAGERNLTPIYVVVGVIAVLILVSLFVHH